MAANAVDVVWHMFNEGDEMIINAVAMLMAEFPHDDHVFRGREVNQILGANIISTGTGEHSSAEVVKCLEKWEFADDVVALCSDTPTGNTGYKLGPGARIEKALGKSLIYLACRHHILELIPKGLFDKLVDKSSSPDIGMLCKALQERW